MLDTGLDNELITSETGFENSVMAAEQAEQYVPDGYMTNEEGNFVNDNNERVYYWVPPSELGDGPVGGSTPESAQRELYKDSGGYYTEAEIRSAWDADEGMGYLKEQTDWDNYWGYLTERQGLIQDGTIYDATGSTDAGRQNRQDFLEANGGLQAMGGAKAGVGAMGQLRTEGYNDYYQGFLDQPEQMQLMAKYGISPVIENKDGDVFGWNGSSYTKIVKVDDHNYGAIVGEMIKSFIVSAATAGVLNLALGSLSGVGGAIGKVATTVDKWLQTMGLYSRTAGSSGAVFGNTTGMGGALEQANAVNAAMSAETIVNLGNVINAAIVGNGIYDAVGVTDNDNNGYTESEDGRYTITNPDYLPPGYIVNVYGNIIHKESGTVAYDGNIYEELYPVKGMGANFITFDPYTDENGGGGADSGDTSSITNSTSSVMTQEEANARLKELIIGGLAGQELYDAAVAAGITPTQLIQANRDGVYTTEDLTGGNAPPNGGADSNPKLVRYDGNPALLDEDGIWEGGGTFFDRKSLDDEGNPRKYYVWTNKETGESVRVYDDELDTYDGGVKDFEAYLKDELPDLTEDELILARKLLEMGDPVGQVIKDIIAGRNDLNNDNTTTVELPNGQTVEAPVTGTASAVGDPCSIGGKYEGTVIMAPSGNLVCKIDVSNENFGGGTTEKTDEKPDENQDKKVVWSPVLGGFVDPSVINPDTGNPVGQTPPPQTPTTENNGDPNTITPSFACESSYIDGTGTCVPVGDPRLPGGGNDTNSNDSPPGEGEACTVAGTGEAGTIQNGECVGSGTGVGPGTNGENGDGKEGDGKRVGMLAGSNGASKASWTPLFATKEFQSRNGNFSKGMFSPNAPNFSLPDYGDQRMGLLSQAWKDLA